MLETPYKRVGEVNERDIGNMQIIQQKNQISFINLMIFILIFSAIVVLFTGINSLNITIMSLIVTVLAQFILVKINKSYDVLHPASMFAICYCYAMVGNFVSEVFLGVGHTMISSQNLDSTVYYCFSCLLAFLFASILTNIFLIKKTKCKIKNPDCYKEMHKKVLGILKPITTILLTLFYAVLIVFHSKYIGQHYGAASTHDIVDIIFFMLYFWSMLFIFFYIITSTIYHKKVFTPTSTIFGLLFMLYSVLLGKRFLAISIIFIFLFAFILTTVLGYRKPVTIYKKIIGAIISLVVIFSIIVMGFLSRGEIASNLSFSARMNQVKYNLNNTVMRNLVATHVLCIIPNYSITSNIMDIIPLREGYRYGMTYINAVSELVPRIFTQDYNSNLAEWFKSYYNPSFEGGFGFSVEAEAYMNFGFLGFIVFAFWGWLLTQSYCNYKEKPYLPWNSFFYALFIITSIIGIRAHSAQIIKQMVYSYFLVEFIKIYIGYSRIKIKLPKKHKLLMKNENY